MERVSFHGCIRDAIVDLMASQAFLRNRQRRRSDRQSNKQG
jgi:hypothetical protein